jgi:hypothetical protein
MQERICHNCGARTQEYEVIPDEALGGFEWISCRDCSFESYPACELCGAHYPEAWLETCDVCDRTLCHECLEDSQLAEAGCTDNRLNPSDPAYQTYGHDGIVDERISAIQRSGEDWWPHEQEEITRIAIEARRREEEILRESRAKSPW